MTKTLRGGRIVSPLGVIVIARLGDEQVEIKCLLPASRSKLNFLYLVNFAMKTNKVSYDTMFIRDWCVFILNFFYEKGKTQALYENLIQQTLKYYYDNNKKRLKEMLHTVYSIAFTSPENDKVQLDEKLFEEFGKKLEDLRPKPIKHRALKGEKHEQLKFMGNWCIAILEFMKKSVPNEPTGFVTGSIDTINKTV